MWLIDDYISEAISNILRDFSSHINDLKLNVFNWTFALSLGSCANVNCNNKSIGKWIQPYGNKIKSFETSFLGRNVLLRKIITLGSLTYSFGMQERRKTQQINSQSFKASQIAFLIKAANFTKPIQVLIICWILHRHFV